jgi:hypothetical protein
MSSGPPAKRTTSIAVAGRRQTTDQYQGQLTVKYDAMLAAIGVTFNAMAFMDDDDI